MKPVFYGEFLWSIVREHPHFKRSVSTFFLHASGLYIYDMFVHMSVCTWTWMGRYGRACVNMCVDVYVMHGRSLRT